ncbi:hypothetical protein DRQ25_04750 [Candidatus Fermentibacteria bacterium]|nr:MAG: hypothetical protein DRQ25_04750 [Candidatus Fermentibacteria bacterium]
MARQPKYSHTKGLIPVTITDDGRIFATRKRPASKFNTCVGDKLRGKKTGSKAAQTAALKSAIAACK